MILFNKFIFFQTVMVYLNPMMKQGGKLGNLLEWRLTKKQVNKIKHCENGNIGLKKEKNIKKLKILHLNKGSKFLTNSNELTSLAG